ncbi:hypothetical protein JTB14_032380 [Gonioctena quinquepunctata]|nr:hypothetical protein JTB14_032380 [Gonioctena quinquepunctata]
MDFADIKPLYTPGVLQKMQEEDEKRNGEIAARKTSKKTGNNMLIKLGFQTSNERTEISKVPTYELSKIEATNSFSSPANTDMDSVDDVASGRETSQNGNTEKTIRPPIVISTFEFQMEHPVFHSDFGFY